MGHSACWTNHQMMIQSMQRYVYSSFSSIDNILWRKYTDPINHSITQQTPRVCNVCSPFVYFCQKVILLFCFCSGPQKSPNTPSTPTWCLPTLAWYVFHERNWFVRLFLYIFHKKYTGLLKTEDRNRQGTALPTTPTPKLKPKPKLEPKTQGTAVPTTPTTTRKPTPKLKPKPRER